VTDTPTPERVEDEFTTIEFVGRDTAFKRFERGLAIAEIVRLRAECARKDAEIARLRVQLGKGSTMNCAKCGGTGFVMSIHTGPSSGGMSYTKCDCGSYMVTLNPGAPRDGE